MKILELDEVKRRWIVLRPDNVDDLYTLSEFIRPGDLVTARTRRKVKMESGADVKPMTLTIEVEKVSFYAFGEELRVLGRIVEGPEKFVQVGSYHTLRIRVGTIIKIERPEGFTDEDLELLREAEALSAIPPVVLVAIEDGEATIGVLTSRELSVVGSLSKNIPKSEEYSSLLRAFFARVLELVRKALEESKTKLLIIAGPGFTKDEFAQFVRERIKDAQILVDSVTSGTVQGVYEIVRRGLPERLIHQHRVSLETRKIEELFEHLAKQDGLAAIGLEETKRAVEYGVARDLLVSMRLINTPDTRLRDEIRKLIRTAKSYRTSVILVSTAHPAGEQFAEIGVAAILRFRVPLSSEEEQ